MSDMPEALAARPRDERSGLPVPYAQATHDDGSVNFLAIDATKAIEAGQRRLCALCGERLGYWIAFVGGPGSAEIRTYSDPPNHPECARAAMTLCPHMARRQRQRARKIGDVTTPDGFVEDKPSEWCVLITRGYKMLNRRGYVIFLADRPKQIERWTYDAHGVLQPARRLSAS